MSNYQLKIDTISALHHEPDLSGLRRLRSSNDRGMRRFLRWLDESGLALHLLTRIRRSGEAENLPSSFVCQLERRLQSNRSRGHAMLAEQGKIGNALTEAGVPHAFLKGFTLIPDFCPAIELRHQADFDILISSEFIDTARRTMHECGYLAESSFATGELQFSQLGQKPASVNEDIYTPEFRHEVDVHRAIWDDLAHVELTAPTDYLGRVTFRELHGVRFACLSLDDSFIVQILHGFRHLLGSWLRVAWLFEIHTFLVRYCENAALWLAIKIRVGGEPAVRDAFGLMLRLTNCLFASPIPKLMRDWCIESLPDALNQWVSTFGMRWALSGISGSKLSLFAHREFIHNARSRRSYLWRRILPFGGKPTIGRIEASDFRTAAWAQLAQGAFLAKRALFHAGSLGSLAVDAVRWSHTLHATRRQRVIGS